MTDEDKTRAQAMINALSQQRAQSADQAVMLAADLAVANARIAELEAERAAALREKAKDEKYETIGTSDIAQ